MKHVPHFIVIYREKELLFAPECKKEDNMNYSEFMNIVSSSVEMKEKESIESLATKLLIREEEDLLKDYKPDAESEISAVVNHMLEYSLKS